MAQILLLVLPPLPHLPVQAHPLADSIMEVCPGPVSRQASEISQILVPAFPPYLLRIDGALAIRDCRVPCFVALVHGHRLIHLALLGFVCFRLGIGISPSPTVSSVSLEGDRGVAQGFLFPVVRSPVSRVSGLAGAYTAAPSGVRSTMSSTVPPLAWMLWYFCRGVSVAASKRAAAWHMPA